jgi:hypothetical protein
VIVAYERLAALAARARELALAQRYDDLAAVQEEAARLREDLPATPPPEAEAPLRAAAADNASVEAALRVAMGNAAAGASRIERGRAALRGYAAAGGSSSARDGR